MQIKATTVTTVWPEKAKLHRLVGKAVAACNLPLTVSKCGLWVWRVIRLFQTQGPLTAHKPGLYNCPTNLLHHWHADCELVSEYESVCFSVYAGYWVYTWPFMFSCWTSLNGTQFVSNFTSCRIWELKNRERQEAPALWSTARNKPTLFTEPTTQNTIQKNQLCTAFSYQITLSLNRNAKI